MTSRSRQWVLTSDPSVIEGVVEDIVELCTQSGFSSRQSRYNVAISVTEALSNAMLRGNRSDVSKQVELAIEISEQRLLVEVADEGDGFDLSALCQGPHERDWLERECGRGVFLMRALMDHIETSRSNARCGHRLRLVLYRK